MKLIKARRKNDIYNIYEMRSIINPNEIDFKRRKIVRDPKFLGFSIKYASKEISKEISFSNSENVDIYFRINREIAINAFIRN